MYILEGIVKAIALVVLVVIFILLAKNLQLKINLQ